MTANRRDRWKGQGGTSHAGDSFELTEYNGFKTQIQKTSGSDLGNSLVTDFEGDGFTERYVDYRDSIAAGCRYVDRISGQIYTSYYDNNDVVFGIGNVGMDVHISSATFDPTTLKLTIADNDTGSPDIIVPLGNLATSAIDNGDGTYTIIPKTGDTPVIINTNSDSNDYDDSLNLNVSGSNVSDALDSIDSVLSNLFSTLGVSAGDMGTFTGSIISDNVDIKTALQELENQVQSQVGLSHAVASANSSDGSIVINSSGPDNQTFDFQSDAMKLKTVGSIGITNPNGGAILIPTGTTIQDALQQILNAVVSTEIQLIDSNVTFNSTNSTLTIEESNGDSVNIDLSSLSEDTISNYVENNDFTYDLDKGNGDPLTKINIVDPIVIENLLTRVTIKYVDSSWANPAPYSIGNPSGHLGVVNSRVTTIENPTTKIGPAPDGYKWMVEIDIETTTYFNGSQSLDETYNMITDVLVRESRSKANGLSARFHKIISSNTTNSAIDSSSDDYLTTISCTNVFDINQNSDSTFSLKAALVTKAANTTHNDVRITSGAGIKYFLAKS